MDATGFGLQAAAGALAALAVFALLALVSLRLRTRERLAGEGPAAFGAGFALPTATSLCRARHDENLSGRAERPSFLFQDEALVDATPGGQQLLALAAHGTSPWQRLMAVLSPRFPGLEAQLAQLLDHGSLRVPSADGRSELQAHWQDGVARLTLLDSLEHEGEVAVDKLALAAMEDELAVLREVATGVPYLTWQEDAEGRITWANAAYLALAEAAASAPALPVWPPQALFPRPGTDASEDGASGHSSTGTRSATPRAEVLLAGGARRWFDLFECPLAGGGRLRAAMPADAIVAAETSRHQFRQTLTSTFAALGAGLAVFDRHRRLILFNPALTDLTGLPVDFLVRKPTFEGFAERLREARILPEPRDFNAWKQRVTRLLSEAERGTFSETWTQPAGQVFSVTGRPMPEGGIAFVIEDVSDEMRLSRHLRAEHELLCAALEQTESATCVYSGDGLEVCASAAWRKLWPETEGRSLPVAQAQWRAASAGEWQRAAADPCATPGDSGDSHLFSLQLCDGRDFTCRMLVLPHGALMVQFTPGRVSAPFTASGVASDVRPGVAPAAEPLAIRARAAG